jgi:hypothetical protein
MRTRLPQVALLLFALISLAQYWPVIGGKVPIPADVVLQFPAFEEVRGSDFQLIPHAEMGDLVTAIYPWRKFAAEWVKRGELPLWNPYVLGGSPFVANSQSAVFYPLNALYYLLSTPLAWSVSIMLKVTLAGFFTALFARAIGASVVGSAASGVIFALGGFVTCMQGFPTADAVIWLPMALLGIERLRTAQSLRNIAWTSFALAMPVLAGHPETAAHIAVISVLFAVHILICFGPDRPAASRTRFAAYFAVSSVLAMALAAIQILPTLEWLQNLHQREHFWGARPLSEIGALLSRSNVTLHESAVQLPEGGAYIGPVALVLAFLSLLRGFKRPVVFFWLLVAVCLQIAYGFGPVYAITPHLPVIAWLKNWRLLFGLDFSIAVLAGMGLTALQSRKTWTIRAPWQGWVLTGLGACTALAGLWALQATGNNTNVAWRTPLTTAFLLFMSLALLAAAFAHKLSWKRCSASLLVLLTVDLFTFSHNYMPFFKASEIFPQAPIFDFLQKQPQPFRVASVGLANGPNFEMPYDLASPAGYDIQLQQIRKFLDGLYDPAPPALTLEATQVAGSADRRLELLNVKYLITTPVNGSSAAIGSKSDRFREVFSDNRSMRIFEVISALQRAYLVPLGKVELVESEEAALACLKDPGFDPRTSVVLQKASFLPGVAVSMDKTPEASSVVTWKGETPDDIELQVTATEAGIVVLSQMNYPGWNVYVNDQRKTMLQPNLALMGVALPPGQHEVRFSYEPDGWPALSKEARPYCWGGDRGARCAVKRVQSSSRGRPPENSCTAASIAFRRLGPPPRCSEI